MSNISKTTFERYKEILEKTTISDKLDYKSLLIHALRTVETSILSGDKHIIESSIWTLYNVIPESWHDQKFNRDIDGCYVVEQIDMRPLFAGQRMSKEACEKINIPISKEKKRTNHYKMLKVCVNLLERLGVLMRRTPKAWIGGKSGVVPDSPIH